LVRPTISLCTGVLLGVLHRLTAALTSGKLLMETLLHVGAGMNRR
jgi:hypothetical protein